MIGPPDGRTLAAPAPELRWACGCLATAGEHGSFAIDPCEEHAPEFEDAG